MNDSNEDSHDVEFSAILTQDHDHAICNVLRIGHVQIMLDCGIDFCKLRKMQDQLSRVTRVAAESHLLLLSGSTTAHIGCLPYLQTRLDKMPRVLATSPVAKLGSQSMLETCIQLKENPLVVDQDGADNKISYKELDQFNLKDVELAFENVELVSYQEIKRVRIKGTSLILRAIANGASVGGACWSIEYNNQTIVYAPDINDLESAISAPLQADLLRGASFMVTNGHISPIQNGERVTKIYNYVNEEKLKNRLEHILLDPKGQVLLPISNKSAILNILIVLENLFNRSQKLQSPVVRPNPEDKPVIYLEHMSKDTLDVAKSHLNWMNFRGRHYFQDFDDNPFALKNIKVLTSSDELAAELEEQRPRVFVASSATLESGFGKMLLRQLADIPQAMIIFTDQMNMWQDCLAKRILAGEKLLHLEWYERVKQERPSNEIVEAPKEVVKEVKQATELEIIMVSGTRKTTQADTNGANTNIQSYGNDERIVRMMYATNFRSFKRGKFSRFANVSALTRCHKLTYYGLDDIHAMRIHSLNASQALQPAARDTEASQADANMALFKRKMAEQAIIENEAQANDQDKPQLNRLHQLQHEYDYTGFKYDYQRADMKLNCQVCYLPFEGRIDKESFELFLQQTIPSQLVILTTSEKRQACLQQFCQLKELPIKITQLSNLGKFTMCTNAAVKNLLIQSSLFNTLPLQTIMPSGAINSSYGKKDLDWLDKINQGTQSLLRGCGNSSSKVYQVARIQAIIRRRHRTNQMKGEHIAPDEQELGIVDTGIDELTNLKLGLSNNMPSYQDSKPSLYFRVNGEHSMRDLKHFLEAHNFQMILLDGCLNFNDKVFIYFDQTAAIHPGKSQLRFSGTLCKEYFQIRRLVNQHLGRL